MTPQIALVLGILLVALVLLVTERVRMDLVALLVLGALAVSGLVPTNEALSGFGNPAVVTVWAMFILSAGLARTGVAGQIGRRVLRLAGSGETRIVAVVMLSSGFLSAFMNNIGVAALMLPVVMEVSRSTGRPPSRLLMPLSYGCLLGGLTTLIGTPPNLLASEALREQGLEPFGMFDYTPVGLPAVLAGIAFVALLGRRLLPLRDPARETPGQDRVSLRLQYALDERTVVLHVPARSVLAGRTLRESRLGTAAGLNVYAVIRAGEIRLAPDPDSELRGDDRLVVEGKLDRLDELRAWRELAVESEDLELTRLVSAEIGLAELGVAGGSELVGQTLRRLDFRRRYGPIVLALRRGEEVLQSGLADETLRDGDRLLVQGHREHLDALRESKDFAERVEPSEAELTERYRLHGRILAVRVPGDSILVGRSLAESRIGDALGSGVLGLVRDDERILMPEADQPLRGEDRLLVRGQRGDVEIFTALQELEIESEAPGTASLESDRVGLMEVVLSPRASLVGRTLRGLAFRARYGLRVLAILREGRVQRSNLRGERLRFGDALLLMGPRERLDMIARDPDFLVLDRPAPIVQTAKAPLSILIMIGVLVPVLLGWISIAISAICGAALMVLTRCLSMDEAYEAIEWRSVFLIAGMLPLGGAMAASGAASYLAEGMLTAASPLGPWGVVIALYLVTSAATTIIPTAALIVLMAPIVRDASVAMNISTHAAMMAVAIAASASFTSPVSHPANVLVMGPGGYRFVDYLKVGVPLTLVVMVVALLLLPWFWPIQ